MICLSVCPRILAWTFPRLEPPRQFDVDEFSANEKDAEHRFESHQAMIKNEDKRDLPSDQKKSKETTIHERFLTKQSRQIVGASLSQKWASFLLGSCSKTVRDCPAASRASGRVFSAAWP